MKVALCISGQMRTYKKCYGYIKENIIEPLDPDVFIYTESSKGVTNRMNVKDRGAVKEGKVFEQSIRRIYKPQKLMIDEPFNREKRRRFKSVEVPDRLIKVEPDHWEGNIPNFYGIKKCNDMKKNYELSMSMEYDIVIRMRPDILVRNEIPEEVIENRDKLWHSHRNPEEQISDKLAISSSENMDYYSSVWDRLPEYWQDPVGNGEWKDVRVGERLLRIHMEKSDIEVKHCRIDHDILRKREYWINKVKKNTTESRSKSKRWLRKIYHVLKM